MAENNNSKSGGMSAISVLQIVFIVLKLTGGIHWSWVWVLSPLWISLGLWLVIALIALIVILPARFIAKRKRRVFVHKARRVENPLNPVSPSEVLPPVSENAGLFDGKKIKEMRARGEYIWMN